MAVFCVDLDGHEGHAMYQLPDGTLSTRGPRAHGSYTGWVASCECSGRKTWTSPRVHPPTAAGEEAALDEWESHALPHLMAIPAGMAEEIKEARKRIRALARERPDAALAVLRMLVAFTVDLKERGTFTLATDSPARADFLAALGIDAA